MLNQCFQAFGATVIVPVMIFIVAVCLRVKPQVALMSAFYTGVGLTGFGWIINEFTPVVTKIVKQMVNATGLKLPIADIGWQAGSLASFGSTVGLTFFVGGLIVELLLFAFGVTKVFMATNLWNNYGFMVWATLVYYVTHNFWLALGTAFFMLLYTLLLAEIQADRWSEYYGMKNATVSTLHNIEQVIPAILLDPLWNRLGFNKVNLTPAAFQKKLGFWGEPVTIGAVLGLVIGILGNLNRLGTIAAWGQITKFSIQLAAVMVIFPLVTSVFTKAFKPLADEIDAHRMADNPDEDDVSDDLNDPKRWFLAVDDGVGYGEPATIISGAILIPLMVLMAFILPGNKVLPIVDLISLPYIVESIVALTNGNMLKVIANTLVWCSLGLYAASALGPVYTGALTQAGIAIPAGVVMITSFNLMARPFNAIVFLAFVSGNPWYIGGLIVLYLVTFVFVRKRRPQIWGYLRRMAAKNAAAE